MSDVRKGSTIRRTRTYRCPRCGGTCVVTEVKMKELSGPEAMYRRRRGHGTLSDMTARVLSRLIVTAKNRMGWSDDDFARLGEEDVEILKRKMLREGLSPVYIAQVVTAVRRAIRAARETEGS